MLRMLILLQLSEGGSEEETATMFREKKEQTGTAGNGKNKPLYSPRGVLRVLGEKLCEEFTWSEADFDREFMHLIEEGCIRVEECGTCSLFPKGRKLLAESKTVAMIQGRAAAAD